MSDPEAQERRNQAQEARNVAQEKRDSHQRALLTLLTMVLIVMVAISVQGVMSQHSIDGNDVNSRRSRSETRFLLCSRNTSVVDQAKKDDVRIVCDGYDTLAHAYRTQHVAAP